MKKLSIIAMLAAFCSTAFAAFNPTGTNGALVLDTVTSLKNKPDEAYVTLEGNIEKQLSREHYLFRDTTGTVEVEIDDDVWNGVNVNPSNKVRLTAEIDKDWNETEVDVKSIQVIH